MHPTFSVALPHFWVPITLSAPDHSMNDKLNLLPVSFRRVAAEMLIQNILVSSLLWHALSPINLW